MQNGQRTGGINIHTPVGGDWRLAGAGDVNGDGTDDIVWQHRDGQVHYWPIQNGQRTGGINIHTPVGADWRLAGAGDVNGDGTDDIIWQHRRPGAPLADAERSADRRHQHPYAGRRRLVPRRGWKRGLDRVSAFRRQRSALRSRE